MKNEVNTPLKNWFLGEIKEHYVACSADPATVRVTDSTTVHNYLRQIWEFGSIEIYESFYALYINRANKVISWSLISKGGTAGTVADPKLVFRRALLSGASGVVIAHNHPSGNSNPSQADRDITNKIKHAARALDMELLDHLILTPDAYLSFADEGIL